MVFAFSIPAAVQFGDRIDGGLVISSLASAGIRKLSTNFFRLPRAGYNKARGVFGGTAAEYQATPGGLFDTLRMHAAGSGNSLDSGMEFAGSRSRDSGLFRDSDWGMGYQYADQPSDLGAGAAVRQSGVGARYGASTKTMASATLV